MFAQEFCFFCFSKKKAYNADINRDLTKVLSGRLCVFMFIFVCYIYNKGIQKQLPPIVYLELSYRNQVHVVLIKFICHPSPSIKLSLICKGSCLLHLQYFVISS